MQQSEAWSVQIHLHTLLLILKSQRLKAVTALIIDRIRSGKVANFVPSALQPNHFQIEQLPLIFLRVQLIILRSKGPTISRGSEELFLFLSIYVSWQIIRHSFLNDHRSGCEQLHVLFKGTKGSDRSHSNEGTLLSAGRVYKI